MDKLRLGFEKIWNKINSGTYIDNDICASKRIVKYHGELIYREVMDIKAEELNDLRWALEKIIITAIPSSNAHKDACRKFKHHFGEEDLGVLWRPQSELIVTHIP